MKIAFSLWIEGHRVAVGDVIADTEYGALFLLRRIWKGADRIVFYDLATGLDFGEWFKGRGYYHVR